MKLFKSAKFWAVVIGVVAILAVFLAGPTVGLVESQMDRAVTSIEWLVGILLGTRAATDVASMFRRGGGE